MGAFMSSNFHTFRFLVLAFGLFGLAGCQATSSTTYSPPSGAGIDSPGTFSSVRRLDAEKWVRRGVNGEAQRFDCRPLACSESSWVILARTRSPTRNPDRVALEKFARESIAAQISAANIRMATESENHVHMKMLNSKVTQIRGFPAVVTEVLQTGIGSPSYGSRALIFAGNSGISVFSWSKSMNVARKNQDSFIADMDIFDVPPTEQPKAVVSSVPIEAAQVETKR